MLRGDEAKQRCPKLQLVRVPERRGKADLSCYRQAGAEVIRILAKFSDCIERASIDEAFLDITECVHKRIQQLGFQRVKASMLPGTHVAGYHGREAGGVSPETSENSLKESQHSLEVSEHSLQDRTVEGEDGNPACSGYDPLCTMMDDVLSEEEEEEEEEDTDAVNEGAASELLASEGGGEEGGRSCEEMLSEWLEGGEELSLAVGALVAMEMRQAVLEGTGFTCSAGIAHNKVPTFFT